MRIDQQAKHQDGAQTTDTLACNNSDMVNVISDQVTSMLHEAESSSAGVTELMKLYEMAADRIAMMPAPTQMQTIEVASANAYAL